MIFGKRLKAERERQGLKVQAIAEACDISRSYLTLIENGKRLPGKKILPKLSSALGIQTSVVLNWYLEEIRQKILE